MKERNVVLILMLAFGMIAGIASGQNYYARVNFQESGSTDPIPAGWVKDFGETYAARNGFTYGWDVDNTGTTRNRNNDRSPDELWDSCIHLQKSGDAIWEIAIPDGVYNIRLAAGDAGNADMVQDFDVEGVLVLDPDPLVFQYFNDYMLEGVVVSDGKLTVKPALTADAAKLCFIDIEIADPTFNPPPVVNAGSDLTMWIDDTAQLAGAITDADPLSGPAGTVTSYWKKESGPGNVTFDPADTTDVLDPTATFDAGGTYELMLQASDGDKDANDIMTITVMDPAVYHLIGLWEMENDLVDSTTSANHGEGWGTLPGGTIGPLAAEFSTDVAVGTYSLSMDNPADGTPEHYVYLGDAPELDMLDVPPTFTASAWVKTTNPEERIIIHKGSDGSGGHRWQLLLNDSGGASYLNVIMDDNVTKIEPVARDRAINDGVWHHVVGTCDGAEVKLYVDGVLMEDITNTASVASDYDISGMAAQNDGYIGCTINYGNPDPNGIRDNRTFAGLIDDMRVYNYALPLDDDPAYDSVLSLTAMGPIVADVDAGADFQTRIRLTTPTPLQGTIVDPGAPGGEVYKWETVSRPAIADSNAVFSNDATLATDVYFPEFGEYELRLTCLDDGGSDVSEITIMVVESDCSDVLDDGLILTGDIAGGGLLGDEPDCRVTLADVAAFAADFLRCNNPQDVDCIDPYL